MRQCGNLRAAAPRDLETVDRARRAGDMTRFCWYDGDRTIPDPFQSAPETGFAAN
jgi:hypothetical protein